LKFIDIGALQFNYCQLSTDMLAAEFDPSMIFELFANFMLQDKITHGYIKVRGHSRSVETPPFDRSHSHRLRVPIFFHCN